MKNIYARVININNVNEDMIYKQIEDLAITYYIPIGSGIANINRDSLDVLNISERELHEIAMENTIRDKKIKFQSITKVIEEMTGVKLSVIKRQELYIVTTESNNGTLGAIALFYKDTLKEISEALEDDLVIFPSSIHEFLVVRANGCSNTNPKMLKEMVAEINITEVSENERLSDNVYFYNRTTKEFAMI